MIRIILTAAEWIGFSALAEHRVCSQQSADRVHRADVNRLLAVAGIARVRSDYRRQFDHQLKYFWTDLDAVAAADAQILIHNGSFWNQYSLSCWFPRRPQSQQVPDHDHHSGEEKEPEKERHAQPEPHVGLCRHIPHAEHALDIGLYDTGDAE